MVVSALACSVSVANRACWCRYQPWPARLVQGQRHDIRQAVAIRDAGCRGRRHPGPRQHLDRRDGPMEGPCGKAERRAPPAPWAAECSPTSRPTSTSWPMATALASPPPRRWCGNAGHRPRFAVISLPGLPPGARQGGARPAGSAGAGLSGVGPSGAPGPGRLTKGCGMQDDQAGRNQTTVLIERSVALLLVLGLLLGVLAILKPFTTAILFGGALAIAAWPLRQALLRRGLGRGMASAAAAAAVDPGGGAAGAAAGARPRGAIGPGRGAAERLLRHARRRAPGWLARVPVVGQALATAWGQAVASRRRPPQRPRALYPRPCRIPCWASPARWRTAWCRSSCR